jgi:lysyl-tRNA synthetase class 1
MFWTDEIAEKLDKKDSILIDDAWSTSGFAHVGSLRGLIIHDVIYKSLLKKGFKAKYTFIMDDIDPMDGLPGYLDKKAYESEMGKPLCNIPAPKKGHASLARYFGEDFISTAAVAGATPEFKWNSELYKEGKYNDVIRTALDKAKEISRIYKDYNKVDKGDNWFPFQPICEKCGKIGTTTVTAWNGEEVSYECEENKVEWAKGCGYSGKQTPFDGKGKLYWRVEWPAKWKALGITIEGEGKDHWSAGGSRGLANILIKNIFDCKPPVDIRYDWLYIKGKKMSSSKGVGVTAREMAELLPKEVLKFLMAKNPRKTIDFDPSGNTIPNLYDDYDRAMSAYMGKINFPDLARAYEAVQEENFEPGFRMRFSKLALSIQMPRLNIREEAEKEKGSTLTKKEVDNLTEREEYAYKWLDQYAPENFVFKITENSNSKEVNKAISELTPLQKKFLGRVLEEFDKKVDWTGDEMHSKLHEIKEEIGIEPKEAFSSIYKLFLNKDSGPQAGWLLASIDIQIRNEILDKATE